MADDALIEVLPELIAMVRRDGTILRAGGGRGLGLEAQGGLAGKALSDVFPGDGPAQLTSLIGRVLRDRRSRDAAFSCGGRRYEARIVASSPDWALCVIRDPLPTAVADAHEEVRGGDDAAVQRRDLFAQLSQSIAEARLRSRMLAVSVIHLQGMQELGAALDFDVVDRVTTTQLRGLSGALADGQIGYAGRIADNLLLVVIERCGERDQIRALVERLLQLLSEPVVVVGATFFTTPSAGVTVLGEDGHDTRQLIEGARSALLEARRNGTACARFYSDTLQLRRIARWDLQQELQDAIAHDGLALRYAPRHCLESGRRIAVCAYLCWPHPVRGQFAAAEFLPIAENTGLTVALSRWALQRFQRDLPRLRAVVDPGTRYSFGALKAHLSSAEFQSDVEALLADGALRPEHLELRIAERTLAGLADPGALLRPLVKQGISIVIDEFGRGFTSLPRLSRLPVHALQLDRRLALAAGADPVARRAAAAALAIARALELIPMSAGIDNSAQRQYLHSIGCAQGLGDAFKELPNMDAASVDASRGRIARPG
jgi:predicted signal transduction protein with EAL and GGDEF domain